MMLKFFISFCILQSIPSATPQSVKIGLPPISSRIVGGTIVTDGQAPYQCSLQKNGKHACGCAIVSKKWIVTTASCIYVTGFNGVQILVGTNDLYKGGVRYEPMNFITHQKYNEPRDANDIALIQVTDEIKFDDKTKAIKVSSKLVNEGTNLLFTGWGRMSADGENSRVLQSINLMAISNYRCQQALKNGAVVHDSTLCTFNKVDEGTCFGDAGSPLVIRSATDEFELVGLATWANTCAQGSPDGFTRISYIYDWIQEKIVSIPEQPPKN